MQEQLKEIQSKRIEDILKSGPDTLLLLRVYSKLYLKGEKTAWCTACMRRYHAEIVKTGQQKLEKMKDVLNRTCKPNWKGVKWIPATARHWHADMITDEEAVRLLGRGHLTSKDFLAMPASFITEAPVVEPPVVEPPVVEPPVVEPPVVPKNNSNKKKRRR